MKISYIEFTEYHQLDTGSSLISSSSDIFACRVAIVEWLHKIRNLSGSKIDRYSIYIFDIIGVFNLPGFLFSWWLVFWIVLWYIAFCECCLWMWIDGVLMKILQFQRSSAGHLLRGSSLAEYWCALFLTCCHRGLRFYAVLILPRLRGNHELVASIKIFMDSPINIMVAVAYLWKPSRSRDVYNNEFILFIRYNSVLL